MLIHRGLVSEVLINKHHVYLVVGIL